jgi:hypothetical protein
MNINLNDLKDWKLCLSYFENSILDGCNIMLSSDRQSIYQTVSSEDILREEILTLLYNMKINNVNLYIINRNSYSINNVPFEMFKYLPDNFDIKNIVNIFKERKERKPFKIVKDKKKLKFNSLGIFNYN